MPLHPPFGPALLRRAFLLWLGLRALAGLARSAIALPGGEPPHPVFLNPEAALVVVAAVAAAAYLDARRRGETLFLELLGVSRARTACLAALPAAVPEGVLLAVRWL